MRGGSLRLGSLVGIGVYVHWTFLLLVGWALVITLGRGRGLAAAIDLLVFIVAVFGCIVLHELGHALAARRFGIRTRDIVLLPIGGLARLERMPERPMQEFVVAAAGPLVNVVIALALYVGLLASPWPARIELTALDAGNLLVRLVAVNVILVLFNLIPAIPLDGGRMLRAMLALWLGGVAATRLTATMGQLIAAVLAVVGLLYHPLLVLIAVFVFFGARAEAQMAMVRDATKGLTAADVMTAVPHTIDADDAIDRALEILQTEGPSELVVMSGNQVLGLMGVRDVHAAVDRFGPDVRVGDAAARACLTAEIDEPLNDLLRRMHQHGCDVAVVLHAGQPVGLVTLDRLARLATGRVHAPSPFGRGSG